MTEGFPGILKPFDALRLLRAFACADVIPTQDLWNYKPYDTDLERFNENTIEGGIAGHTQLKKGSEQFTAFCMILIYKLPANV